MARYITVKRPEPFFKDAMKVKDLIEQLQKFDEYATVLVDDRNNYDTREVVGVEDLGAGGNEVLLVLDQ